MFLQCSIVISLFVVTFGFRIQESSPTQWATKGQSVTLTCKSSHRFEYCSWIAPNQQKCNFEWKMNLNQVIKKTCSLYFREDDFVGNYRNQECSLRISRVTQADEGVWTCVMEKYLFGPWRGRKDNSRVILSLLESESTIITSTRTTTTSTRTTTTSTTTSTSTTTTITTRLTTSTTLETSLGSTLPSIPASTSSTSSTATQKPATLTIPFASKQDQERPKQQLNAESNYIYICLNYAR